MKKLLFIILVLVGCTTEEDPCHCEAVFSEYDATEEVWMATDTSGATHCEPMTVAMSDSTKMDIICD